MANPSPSTAEVRGDLAAALVEYELDASQKGFIGLDIMPVSEVDMQSANIKRIKAEDMLQEQNDERASGGGYNESSYRYDNFYYATEEHGFEEKVDDRNRAIASRYFDAEVLATKRTRDVVLRNQEKRIVTQVTSAAAQTKNGKTFTLTNAGAAYQWDNKANATPIEDVQNQLKAVRLQCGFIPNLLAMDWEAWLALSECAEVIDRIKFAGIDDPKNVSLNALASLLKVEKVKVAGGIRNAANQGQARSLKSLWPRDRVLVAYVDPSQDVRVPTFGRTFHWNGDGSSVGGTIETYRWEKDRSDRVRCRMETDEFIHYPECAAVITGVLAAP